MVDELEDRSLKSDTFKIKLLESFSLPATSSALKNSLITSETEIKSKLNINFFSKLDTNLQSTFTGGHCDHTYSIPSCPSYKQDHEHVAISDLSSSQKWPTPSVIQTGELTMKIVNSIPALIPKEPSKKSKVCQANSRRDAPYNILATCNNYYMHTRSKTKSSVVHVIQPTECCVICQQNLFSSIKSSVFCLKTGNVLITCQNCNTKMSLKGAFKLPKYL